MHFHTSFVTLALAALVHGHGLIESPAARQPGDATAKVCGQKMVDFYKQDGTSYPEALMRSPGWNTDLTDACDLYLCKGYQFADNVDNVQKYTPGESIDMKVFIRIPHIGYANVSVVDTKSDSIIGEPLKVWESGYADGAKFPNLPKDELEFSVTMPDLDGQCTEAGACVIQWYWFGQGQTYESCIDFVLPADEAEAEAPMMRGRSWRQ